MQLDLLRHRQPLRPARSRIADSCIGNVCWSWVESYPLVCHI
jgi:hypothetical protein